MDSFHGYGRVFNNDPIKLSEAYQFDNCQNIDDYEVQYEGEFELDKKQGKGIMILSNQEYFDGRFKNGKLHGMGKFYTLNGKIIEGIW